MSDYTETLEKIEAPLANLDIVTSLTSIAISMKRIADQVDVAMGDNPNKACNQYGESFLPALTRAIEDALIRGRGVV